MLGRQADWRQALCSVVGLIGRHAVKARVRAVAIVKIEIPPNRSPCLRHALVGMQVDLLVFHAAPQPFDKHVVPPGALPSMLIAMSFLISTLVKAAPVNWLP